VLGWKKADNSDKADTECGGPMAILTKESEVGNQEGEEPDGKSEASLAPGGAGLNNL
jgi:hypothetical protein